MKEKIKKFFFGENIQEKTKESSSENEEIPEEKESESQEKNLDNYTLGEIKQMSAKLDKKRLLSDIISEEFAAFSDGRSGNLEDQYISFLKLKDIIESSKNEKDSSSEPARSVSGQDERLHSGFGNTSARNISSGLTKRQMDMARSAGMSFREYEELLESVPAKIKNKF